MIWLNDDDDDDDDDDDLMLHTLALSRVLLSFQDVLHQPRCAPIQIASVEHGPSHAGRLVTCLTSIQFALKPGATSFMSCTHPKFPGHCTASCDAAGQTSSWPLKLRYGDCLQSSLYMRTRSMLTLYRVLMYIYRSVLGAVRHHRDAAGRLQRPPHRAHRRLTPVRPTIPGR